MSARPWYKFYPADWRNDPRLRMCSLAARGLWKEMLCLMHEASPRGHLLVASRSPTDAQLAVLAGATSAELPDLIAELEAAGVFSRTKQGVIYSRKMVRDEKLSKTGRKFKKWGLSQSTETKGEKPRPSRGATRGASTQRPETRDQKDKKERTPVGVPKKAAAAASTHDPPEPHHIPADWAPSEADRAYAIDRGIPEQDIDDEAAEFADYWRGRTDKAGRKVNWSRAWQSRCRDLAGRRGRSGQTRRPASVTSLDTWLEVGRERDAARARGGR